MLGSRLANVMDTEKKVKNKQRSRTIAISELMLIVYPIRGRETVAAIDGR
jgi:hypothetical protein